MGRARLACLPGSFDVWAGGKTEGAVYFQVEMGSSEAQGYPGMADESAMPLTACPPRFVLRSALDHRLSAHPRMAEDGS